MEKNLIIELIKQNRIGEAIDMLEKASIGTDTHHELILLASAFSDYAQKNRTATVDSQTLEMQRNQITNKVLYYLDEVPAEALSAMTPPPMPKKRAEPNFNAQSAFSASGNAPQPKAPWLKYGLIGAAAMVVLIILIGIGSDDPTIDDNGEFIEETQGALPFVDPGTQDGGLSAEDYNFTAVTYYDSDREMEAVIYMDSPGNWILALADGSELPYTEIDMKEWSVTLQGEQGIIQINLEKQQLLEIFENQQYSYQISEYH